MDYVQWFINVFKSPTTYVIMLLVALFGWMFVKTYAKKLSLTKGKIMLIAIVGLFLTMGGAGLLGVGSVTDQTTSGVQISQLQTTTAYAMGTGGNITDAGTDDTKMSDFYIGEGSVAGNDQIQHGVFMVTRAGNLDPASCSVKVHKPPRYDISDTTYHLVDEDANTGKMYAYVKTGSTSSVATNTDPKETNQLAFADGVAVGYVAFNITIDETGVDPLTQYDYKDVNVDICGYPYTFRIHKNDA